MGILKDIVSNTPRVLISGRESIIAENISGIASFSDRQIIARTGIGLLYVNGDRLEILTAKDSEIHICGKILSVSFE